MSSGVPRLHGVQAVVATLLAAAADRGVVITRVKLAKLLYLSDIRAVEDLGHVRSGLTWIWWHYGPYDLTLESVERTMVESNILEVEHTVNYFDHPEYRLRLRQTPLLDIDSEFATIIDGIVGRYGFMSASTLKDITYQTPPMLHAQANGVRGVRLDFHSARAVPEVAPIIRRLKKVLAANPREVQTSGDMDELTREIQASADLLVRANATLLG